jgi:hypothetical protein
LISDHILNKTIGIRYDILIDDDEEGEFVEEEVSEVRHEKLILSDDMSTKFFCG